MRYEDILGYAVQDNITGIQGVCTSIVQCLHNVDQVSIQPPSKDGEAMPEAYSFDLNNVSVLSDLAVIQPVPYTVKLRFDLGDSVSDSISGVTGVLTRRYLQVNGCVYYVMIHSKPDNHGRMVESYLSQERLVFKKKAAKPAATPFCTGGPAVRVPRF